MSIYRPWLDGVRALAVLMVVACHLGPHSLESLGSTGVGVFFALSGYLITGLLISEYRRSGDIALRDFYVRRLTRLMPALLVVVAICDAIYLATGRHEEIKSSIAAVLYVANYATIFRGYHIPGFGHTWSLAVEEHFYLLWPPALLAMLPRFSLRRIAAMVAVFCAALMLWRVALVLAGAPPRMLYVGSIERFDSILYGAVAALLSAAGVKARAWWLLAGAASLLPSIFPLAGRFYLVWSSPVLAIGISAALWALETTDMLTLQRYLSHPALVKIGVLSYGIYLWHIPIAEILTRVGLHGALQVMLTLGLTYAASELSAKLVEMPIRDGFRKRRLASVLVDPALAAPSTAVA